MRPLTSPPLVALIIAAAIASPDPATASPLVDPTLGGAVFTGPTHPHATAVYLNPAALGLSGIGWHVYVGGNLRLDHYDIQRRQIDPATESEIPGPHVKALTLTPGGILAAHVKRERVAIGFAAFTPQAEKFIDKKEALRYHTFGGELYQFTGFALATSFRATRRFYMGAGFSFGNHNRLRLRFARDRALEAGTAGIEGDCGGSPCGIENDMAAQRFDIRVQSDLKFWGIGNLLNTLFNGLSLNTGLMWMVVPDWWLALTYQGSPGLFGSGRRITGDVTVTDAPADGGFEHSGRAVVDYDLPYQVSLGLRGPMPGLPDFELTTSLRWQSLSSHKRFDIRMFGGDLDPNDVPEQILLYRGFRDVWRVDAGIERLELDNLRFGGRLSAETAAVNAHTTTPLQVAGLNFGVNLGAELRVATYVVLGVGYGFTWFPTSDSSPSVFDPIDRIRCVDSDYALDQCDAVRDGRAVPTASARYGRMQHTVSLSARLDFL